MGVIHHCSNKKKVDVVAFLLQNNAKTEIVDRDGCTPLHSATFRGNTACVAKLVEAGANVNHPDVDSSTPLHKAAYSGAVECVQLLLDARADAEAVDVDGVTALHKAAFNGHWEIIKVLLSRGAERNRADRHGSTALHKAAFSGSVASVKVLVEAGADVMVFDGEGHSPMHLACHKMHPEVLRALLQSLAKVERANLQSNNAAKETPLHLASKSGCAKCVEVLIEAGADLKTVDAGGLSALDVATRLGRNEVIAVLTGAGAPAGEDKGKDEAPVPDAAAAGPEKKPALGPVDRWGFLGATELTVDEESHKQKEIEREIKWVKMRSDWGRWMGRRRRKLRERCLKGIPDSFRPFAWVRLSGARELRGSKPDNYYQELVSRKEETPALEVIHRDLHRTFPDHVQFRDVTGRDSLLRVLKAFSFHNPKIGYCK